MRYSTYGEYDTFFFVWKMIFSFYNNIKKNLYIMKEIEKLISNILTNRISDSQN